MRRQYMPHVREMCSICVHLRVTYRDVYPEIFLKIQFHRKHCRRESPVVLNNDD